MVAPDPELARRMVPSARTLAPRIIVAGVLPVIGYALLRPHVSSDAVALAAVMVFPVAEIAYERRHLGRFEPIGIIVLIGIVFGLAAAVALHGNTLLLKVRDSVLTGLFGVVCLGSLPVRRPIMWHMGRSFATGSDPDKAPQFDQMWELPGVPARFRLVTAVWGIGLIGEAVLRVSLAIVLSTQTFLIVSPIVNGLVLLGLLTYTTLFVRASEEHLTGALAEEPAG